jgi:hypothetical protein
VVFQRRLHEHWRARFTVSHLSYTNRTEHQYQAIVKVPGRSRYAIRAGRNLPDKEFRYLRMVIVTTAVYWRLSSELRPEELTRPLNVPAPGRRQSVYIVLRLRTDLCF